jgi:hypothetical protein
LRIEHSSFAAADKNEKRRLTFAMILRSIEEARHMKLPPFDFDRFEADMRAIGTEHGWL